MKKVSIIVPAYNSGNYISDCIESILSQTYKNIEIIIINDGSTDDTEQKCIAFKKDKRVIYKKTNNGGVSAARNLGLKIAKGHYIAFVDSDDIISCDYIQTLVKNIEDTNSDLSTSLPSINGTYSDGGHHLVKGEKIKAEILGNSGGYSPMKLYKKQIINGRKITFNPNIKVCEDLLFNMEYANSIESACIGTQRHYYYRRHNGSTMSLLENKSWFQIIQVYRIIFKKYCKDSDVLNLARFNFLLILSEAKYRKKYAKTKITNKEIDSLYIRTKKEVNQLSFSQTIKIMVYKHFTGIILKLRH